MENHVWLSPDPVRVKRFVALPPERGRDRWVEVYISERLLVHKTRVHMLLHMGFAESEEIVVYKSMKEAENA